MGHGLVVHCLSFWGLMQEEPQVEAPVAEGAPEVVDGEGEEQVAETGEGGEECGAVVEPAPEPEPEVVLSPKELALLRRKEEDRLEDEEDAQKEAERQQAMQEYQDALEARRLAQEEYDRRIAEMNSKKGKKGKKGKK